MKRFVPKASSIIAGLLILSAHAIGQNNIEWETLRPEAEEFSVQLPKGVTSQTTKELYHKFELNVNSYISQPANGAVFAVISMSGIKSNPALYSETERLNSYVDAFKTFFPPKIRKDAVARLTMVGVKVLAGNNGREYNLNIGDLTGVVQTYVTRKRFYAIAFLSRNKDNALKDEFLSSFQIPEKMAPPSTTATVSAPAGGTETVNARPGTSPASIANPDNPDADATNSDRPAEEDSKPPRRRNPVSGGILNGKAVSLPAPDYPAAARAEGVSGTVVVRVTIDEQGNVISATAVSGPTVLMQPSVNAALQAKFSPTLLVGEPVQVVGILTYNFVHN